VNSSQSVTVRFVGCATVTDGGGGAACCCGWFPHPDSVKASRRASEAQPTEERVLGCLARAKRPDCLAAPNSISSALPQCHNDVALDEIAPQSVQDSARIK
jgi:hypothetical protein